MKRLFLLWITVSIFSCEENKIEPIQKETKIKRINVGNSHSVYIMEYEGCRYLSASRGAVTHLETCTNKIH